MFKETRWFSNSDVKKRIIAGKILLVTVKTNRLLILSEHAAVIWDQLTSSEAYSESSIVKILQRRYPDTSVKKLQKDVHQFLTDLQERGFAFQSDQSPLQSSSFNNEKPGTLGHLSFSEEFHNLAVQRNVPISGTLEITQRCYLRCIHCYIDNQPIDSSRESSTDELCSLLQQMAENGCLWLLITGGEPLFRNDFCEIYRFAKELGMIITVFTSATNLTKKIADLFIKYPPFLIEATLHGVTDKTFETISGVPYSFRRFRQGIQLLQDSKIPFHLKMIVMRQNVHEVEAAYQFALNMGAEDFRFDPMVNTDFFHSCKVADLRISIEEATKLDLLEPYKVRWKRIYRTAVVKSKIYRFPHTLLFPCRAGKCSFAISADGYILPCILVRAPSYNLREIPFIKAWKRLNRYTTIVQMKKDNPCLECQVQTCSRCPAWGYLEHNDLNIKSSFACVLQKEREKIFLR